ncbi:MAG: DNA-processing protein DprA [Corallococcus sp.]|nr:DNA-processing protein DprA [Bacillota bacterium]MCM1533960.1 DNA-processing protein DprA [Corallococcus sp.]
MYTAQEKFCIICGEHGLSSSKFFSLADLVDGFEELPTQFSSNAAVGELLGVGLKTLCNSLKENYVNRFLSEMDGNGVTAVTWYSSDYPQQLRDIDDPPYVLFCKGDTRLLNEECLAVVGTRKASSYGRRLATDFTKLLCENFVIVSGLAYGIDSIAHETAINEQGKTIAVLGSGILNIYPSANEGLSRRILEKGGLIISEYGLRAQPLAYRFPHRNRIVAGLSRGLLVCQAPQKSGTNSTVELALEQGKDVFVVPGEIYDSGFFGSNSLIKSMQGACVTTPRDILDYYGRGDSVAQRVEVQLDFDEQKIVNALSEGQLSFDGLVSLTNIAPSDLNFLLANLEIKSIIARLPGNFYRLYGGIK